MLRRTLIYIVNLTSKSPLTVKSFLSVTKSFYKFACRARLHKFDNPLIDIQSVINSAYFNKSGERLDAPRMPEISGTEEPISYRKITDSYFKMGASEWEPHIINDPYLPDRVLEAGHAVGWTLREKIVTLMLFETGARVSEVVELLIGDYRKAKRETVISFLSLLQIPIRSTEKVATWSKRFWWAEMKTGYRIFFKYPSLLKLSLLSSTVQFAVGTAMVIGIPFIKGELNGHSWEYAIFSGAFPIGYALGMVLLMRVPKTTQTMYLGLIGGGLSFVLLFFVHSIPLAWICELFGGIAFPLFNAQSAAVFQREAPKDRLPQLSAVRLLFLRITMPIGIVFAS